MANRTRKIKKKPINGYELSNDALYGIASAALLAAAIDGEISEHELELIAKLIPVLLDHQISEQATYEYLKEVLDRLSSQGFDACLDDAAESLADIESQTLALYVVCGVILSDDEFEPDSEGEFYDALVAKLDFDEDRALEIWNDMAESLDE